MSHVEPEKKALLSNQTYDIVKFIAQYFLPALGTLYFALALLWEFPEPEKVLGTITAIDIFLGAVLGFSKKSYSEAPPVTDGDLTVTTADGYPSLGGLALEEAVEKVQNKDYVILKVINE